MLLPPLWERKLFSKLHAQNSGTQTLNSSRCLTIFRVHRLSFSRMFVDILEEIPFILPVLTTTDQRVEESFSMAFLLYSVFSYPGDYGCRVKKLLN